MNVSRILILVVAVIAGGGAFFLAMSGEEEPVVPIMQTAAKPDIALTKVLFAEVDVPQGMPITEDQMTWVSWPSKDVPEFYITEDHQEYLEALPEMRARQLIRAGEPIYPLNTVAYGDRGLMAAIMTPGMRAVTARLPVENVSGGFVLPGDRVDVYATSENANNYDSSGQNNQQLANSRIVLSNVRVLAIDQIFEQDGEMNAITGKTVTLEVTPSQVRPFLQARNSESLTLILRSVFEDDQKGTDIDQASPDQVVVIRYGQG